MFYAQILLAKKGPLGKIWIAAHWDKKLNKVTIFQTDIPKSVSKFFVAEFSPSTKRVRRVCRL